MFPTTAMKIFDVTVPPASLVFKKKIRPHYSSNVPLRRQKYLTPVPPASRVLRKTTPLQKQHPTEAAQHHKYSTAPIPLLAWYLKTTAPLQQQFPNAAATIFDVAVHPASRVLKKTWAHYSRNGPLQQQTSQKATGGPIQRLSPGDPEQEEQRREQEDWREQEEWKE